VTTFGSSLARTLVQLYGPNGSIAKLSPHQNWMSPRNINFCA
jgi:hypothetical protein